MNLKVHFEFKKLALPRSSNDNVHDQHLWNHSHQWAGFELIQQDRMPVKYFTRQYLAHYLYEFLNRPWLSDVKTSQDAHKWLEAEYDRANNANLDLPEFQPPYVTVWY